MSKTIKAVQAGRPILSYSARALLHHTGSFQEAFRKIGNARVIQLNTVTVRGPSAFWYCVEIDDFDRFLKANDDAQLVQL